MESYTGSGTFTENRFQGLIPLIFSYEPGNLRLFAGSGVLFDAANKITRTSGGQYHEYRIPSKGFYTPVFHGGVG